MRFFLNEDQRKASHSTCYFEFQKGPYHDKCWRNDSINISDALWEKYDLSDLILRVNGNFDYYGITEITKNQWNEIVELSRKSEGVWGKIIAEAVPWAEECFHDYDVISIIGM